MTQYFIHDGQKEKGPFDLEQLKAQSLTKDTPIWYEGLEQWTTAGNVEQLKELFSSRTTPPTLQELVKKLSHHLLPKLILKMFCLQRKKIN